MRKGFVNVGRRGWGRNEVRLGRLIRDGEGHTEIPGAGGNNGTGAGGNSGSGGSADSGNNNNGQGFDANSFWQGQNQNADGAGNPGSASEGESGSGTGGEGGNFAEQLTSQLNGLSFGGPVLTAEIAQQINEGNFEGFQTALNTSMQTAVRHAMAMNVQILRPVVEQILQQVDGRINNAFGNRDNSNALEQEIPAARNPAVRPMVERVFNQALTNTKGDRALAVKQTKEMLSLMTQTMGGDLGLDVAPRGAGDSGRPSNPATNWLDELTGR